MEDKITKEPTLRNNEYYFKQEVFNNLYTKSSKGHKFYHLIELIIDNNNMRLAYRNIKNNKGSKTNGLSGKNISYISTMCLSYFLNLITKLIKNYVPMTIKRVGIPKSNGKTRYLGIKEPTDKIIEQSIYQILDPILTAKFHNNSNGFIKGRSCHRAISQFTNYVIKDKLYFVVDIDIKSFFDNVNHGKLLKQLWTSGIRDKNLISLISKMLKAKIKSIGIPNKGLPQGGILSPLLANVVLNELDWWLDSKRTKGIRFVRYADDLKILCPTYSLARNMLEKTTRWLRERLNLEVNEEKTHIINLKNNYTEFLGIKLKIRTKNAKIKIVSHMNDKAITNCEIKVKKQVRKMKNSNKNDIDKEIDYYNSFVKGIHEYYSMATMISQDLNHIDWTIDKYLYRNMRDVLTFSDTVTESNFITEKYGRGKTLPYIRGKPIIPIGRINYETPKYKGDKINYYDDNSIETFHDKLKLLNMFILEKIVNTPYYNKSVEFNDIVISKFCGQRGKYFLTNSYIFNLSNLMAIKIISNGPDKYDNIILVENKAKELIELEEVDDIVKLYEYKKGFNLNQIKKINEIRKMNNLGEI